MGSSLQLSVSFHFWVVGIACSPSNALSPTPTHPEVASFPTLDLFEDVSAAPDPFADPCVETLWVDCSPGEAPSPTWRKHAVLNLCLGRVLYIGPCEAHFECDPSVFYLGWQPCIEGAQPGKRKTWCNKGWYEYGPCLACEPEVCNGVDDDCDDSVDEGVDAAPCTTACGPGYALCLGGLSYCQGPEPAEETCNGIDDDCDGLTDEGQKNLCDSCGPTPGEVCNALDDDCDGLTDDDLYLDCSTVCGKGYRECAGGVWFPCTAQKPADETCNYADDDCDGLVDEDLKCDCSNFAAGTLAPCAEAPLVCGQGYSRCECQDPLCTGVAWSSCAALCAYAGPDPCDSFIGLAVEEGCNAHDDDCDAQTDEDLARDCYSGAEGTLGVGVCHGGQQVCHYGTWGAWETVLVGGDDVSPPTSALQFVGGLCAGQVTPAPFDACNGVDEDCDGALEDLELYDVVFAIDLSGSMIEEIDAVVAAVLTFAVYYQDEAQVQWGLVVFPKSPGDHVERVVDLSPFSTFVAHLATLDWGLGSDEASIDALWLVLGGDVEGRYWGVVGDSVPTLQDFKLSWREEAERIIVLWSDEWPQSYLKPVVSLSDVMGQLGGVALHLFVPAAFSLYWAQAGGVHHDLSGDAGLMYADLMGVLGALCVE